MPRLFERAAWNYADEPLAAAAASSSLAPQKKAAWGERWAKFLDRFQRKKKDKLPAYDPSSPLGLRRFVREAASQEQEEVKKTNVKFEDVAGQDDAKKELQKVVRFLNNPAKYHKVGAKGVKGVLLFGPPGTGKTLLAQAVASEAGASFHEIKGSDFVEKYVGVGASRVRELFRKARASGGPAVIFIDEIDAMGKKRAEGGEGDLEWEQTLNALLAEMDGFKKDNIVVIAATNRPELLDPALLRGRRFGLKVPVGKPDVEGREAIFKVQTKEVPLESDVDMKTLAKQTPGLSGADIAEVVNDAATMAAERDAEAVAMGDFLAAVDRWTGGHERKLVMTAEERRVVAYHESGHALVSHLLPDADPVRKVTIVPHGLNALGFMQVLPEEERFMYSRAWLLDRMAVALGGRAAELMIAGQPYSGASNDLEQATKLARYMVMRFGMSDKVGHVAFDVDGEPAAVGEPLSEETRRLIDAEVKSLLDGATRRAAEVLTAHRAELETMAGELLEKETLRAEDMDRILGGAKPPTAPPASPSSK